MQYLQRLTNLMRCARRIVCSVRSPPATTRLDTVCMCVHACLRPKEGGPVVGQGRTVAALRALSSARARGRTLSCERPRPCGSQEPAYACSVAQRCSAEAQKDGSNRGWEQVSVKSTQMLVFDGISRSFSLAAFGHCTC